MEGAPWTVCATQTRLELNFVRFGPPRGPLVAPDVGTRSRPNFANVYPVDLFRLFFSNYNVVIPGDPWQWYLDRTMNTIWGLGQHPNPQMGTTRLFQYEAICGAPAYIAGSRGGIFQLRRFVAGLFDSLNCYDLAAISQLAVCIIQDATGVETYDTKWIYCNNYGFIPNGPLIGWPQFQDCNSPFFSQNHLPHYPENDPNRQKFSNHAWIEVRNPAGRRTVLDATHCLEATPNAPSNGTLTRPMYLGTNTDQGRGPYDWIFSKLQRFTHTYQPIVLLADRPS